MSPDPTVPHLRRKIRNLRLLLAGLLVVTLPSVGVIVYTIHGRGGLRYALLGLSAMANDNTEPRYREREGLFQLFTRIPQPDRPIVFLGDSLTERCEWQELLGGAVRAVNRGIGADTTDGVEKRLQSVLDLHPRAVFLMIGANDYYLRRTPGTVAQAIRGIAQRLAANGITVYLQSTVPTWMPDYNNWAKQVNERAAAICDGTQIVWVPLFDRFLQGGVLKREYSYDGIHLNAAGFLVWKEAISAFVARYGDGSPAHAAMSGSSR